MSDISTIFAKDPLSLTREDITAVITRYREARAQFVAGTKSAGATKKDAGPKLPKGNLSLEDLDM